MFDTAISEFMRLENKGQALTPQTEDTLSRKHYNLRSSWLDTEVAGSKQTLSNFLVLSHKRINHKNKTLLNV